MFRKDSVQLKKKRRVKGQRNQKLYRQAKAKRVQYHQTGFATNAKGMSLGRKEKATIRNKKIMNGKAHQ